MLSNRDLLWGDSFINYSMKLRDMPHFEYDSESAKKQDDIIQGTNEILKQKFGKYIMPKDNVST